MVTVAGLTCGDTVAGLTCGDTVAGLTCGDAVTGLMRRDAVDAVGVSVATAHASPAAARPSEGRKAKVGAAPLGGGSDWSASPRPPGRTHRRTPTGRSRPGRLREREKGNKAG